MSPAAPRTDHTHVLLLRGINVGRSNRVGKDTLMESEGRYYELMDLGIGKCRFIVAGLPGQSPFAKLGHVKIGSKYPNVAREYFKKRNMDVEVIKIEGSVEQAKKEVGAA